MDKTKKNIYFGDKLEKFEIYCEKTGRKLSPLVVRAVEEYIIRNPIR
jgi:hypothetical protein